MSSIFWLHKAPYTSRAARFERTHTVSRWCSERQMELIKMPPSLIEMLSVDRVPVGRVTQPATQVLPEAGSTKLIWSPVWMRPCAAAPF